MKEILNQTAAVCGTLVVFEALGRLVPGQRMVRYVRALAALALAASLVSSLLSLDWRLPALPETAPVGEELAGYVEEELADAAGREAEEYLSGLLRAAGIPAEKITVDTSISREGRIDYTRVWASFRYESDAERARALLKNTLGGSLETEVTVLG